MDASRIGRFRGDIERELTLFDDCFARREGRQRLRCDVRGQVSEMQRKCVEAIAAEAGVPETLRLGPSGRSPWTCSAGPTPTAPGSRFARLTTSGGDEAYGNNVQMLQALDRVGQTYLAEVSPSMHGWLVEPTVLQKDHHTRHASRMGRPRRLPRLSAQSAKAKPIDRLCTSTRCATNRGWTTM